MKARKFSFNIPPLKLGPSKSDNKALRDHLAVQLDSPPPTPKSVRPPLSPLAEAELRAACAYVLQNFKPSHIHYDEQNNPQKQQLDYAAIKHSVHREVEQSAPSAPPLSRLRTQDAVATITEGEDEENASSEKFRYKPDTAIQDLFKDERDKAEKEKMSQRRKSAIMRAELLMAQPAKSIVTVARDRSDSHLRSASSPVPTSLLPPRVSPLERPQTIPRMNSVETTGSTPQTDNTDYPWSEKASTAMTSAVNTPARGSKRTSSQALEGSSLAKEPLDADWMKQELEKQKKAQGEWTQEEAVDGEPRSGSVSDTTPTQSSTHTATPVAVRMPARKPVPHSRTASRQESARSDSAQDVRVSREQRRSPVRLVAPQTQSPEVEKSAFMPPPAPSRQAPERPSRAPSRARSVSRRVKDYVRSASTHRKTREEDGSRPPSRSGNATRQVKEYFRPSMDAGSRVHSRKQSMDVGREDSRAVSMDSFHTAGSEIPPTAEQNTSKSRMWKSFHRRERSKTDPYAGASRPATSDGQRTEGRGRSNTRDLDQPPQETSSKAPVNLNRDLPPLPGLDQWKPEEAEDENDTPTQSLPPPSSAPTMSPRSHRSQRSRHEKPTIVSVEPEIGERDEIAMARMGSPKSVSRKPSKVTRAPPVSSAPPPAPPVVLKANFSGPDDFGYEHLSPATSTPETPTASTEPKKSHQRVRSKTELVKPTESPLVRLPTERTGISGKTLNLSRVAGGLSRKASRVHRPTREAPPMHSRNPSDSFTREMSVDTAQMPEFSVTPGAPAVQPVAEKQKGKWWKIGKNGKPGNWMDQVQKSGAKSGVLATDEVADAPFVRY